MIDLVALAVALDAEIARLQLVRASIEAGHSKPPQPARANTTAGRPTRTTAVTLLAPAPKPAATAKRPAAPRGVSAEALTQAKAQWEAGEPMEAIGRRVNRTGAWVGYIAKRDGWPPRPRGQGNKGRGRSQRSTAEPGLMRRCEECGQRTPAATATCQHCGEI